MTDLPTVWDEGQEGRKATAHLTLVEAVDAGQRVLQVHAALRFHTRLAQSGQKSTERRAMRQLGASEQGLERSRKRLQMLAKRGQRGLTADRITYK